MFTIKLSETHLNVVIEALSNTAYRISAPVMAEIGRQVQEQQGQWRATQGEPASTQGNGGDKRDMG